eukprot:Ihof_evm24s8 gene=Ihof_evmTU24s8
MKNTSQVNVEINEHHRQVGKRGEEAADDAEFKDSVKAMDESGDVSYETIAPEEISKELRAALTPLVLEYFNSQDAEDYIENILEVDQSPQGRVAAVVLAIETSLEKRKKERAMVSKLLVHMSEGHIKENLIIKAFDALLISAEDLVLDVPEAPILLGHFIGRAIADEVLHPSFLSERKELGNQMARDIIKTASALVSMRHGMAYLDNIWGNSGVGPLSTLIESINICLKEYLTCCDLKEAQQALKELGVPQFHHEVVYEAVVMALEKTSDSDRRMKLLSTLLEDLAKYGVIS